MQGSLMEAAPMTGREAMLLNPLQLAYIGDTVWDLMVRTDLLHTGQNVHAMHKMASGSVNAGAQARMCTLLNDVLTQEEQALVRRGRNTRSKHPVPKNQSPADYSCATGFEALIGFLYLTGEHERIKSLYRLGRERLNKGETDHA